MPGSPPLSEANYYCWRMEVAGDADIPVPATPTGPAATGGGRRHRHPGAGDPYRARCCMWWLEMAGDADIPVPAAPAETSTYRWMER